MSRERRPMGVRVKVKNINDQMFTLSDVQSFLRYLRRSYGDHVNGSTLRFIPYSKVKIMEFVQYMNSVRRESLINPMEISMDGEPSDDEQVNDEIGPAYYREHSGNPYYSTPESRRALIDRMFAEHGPLESRRELSPQPTDILVDEYPDYGFHDDDYSDEFPIPYENDPNPGDVETPPQPTDPERDVIVVDVNNTESRGNIFVVNTGHRGRTPTTLRTVEGGIPATPQTAENREIESSVDAGLSQYDPSDPNFESAYMNVHGPFPNETFEEWRVRMTREMDQVRYLFRMGREYPRQGAM